jgi:hypothetical protein
MGSIIKSFRYDLESPIEFPRKKQGMNLGHEDQA